MVNKCDHSDGCQNEMKQQADQDLFNLGFIVLIMASMNRIIKLAFNAEGCGTRRSI